MTKRKNANKNEMKRIQDSKCEVRIYKKENIQRQKKQRL